LVVVNGDRGITLDGERSDSDELDENKDDGGNEYPRV
jgi:hypothetical protein